MEAQAKIIEPIASFPTIPFYSSMRSVLSEQTSNQNFTFNFFYVVGVGGTGGFLVPHLARYIASLPYSKYCVIVLIDGDTVEDKNIIRQNFIRSDIGKNKAEVLAERYGKAFGLPILAIPQHLTEENWDRFMSCDFLYNTAKLRCFHSGARDYQASSNVCIIGCVDNNKTRKMISEKLGWRQSYSSHLFTAEGRAPNVPFLEWNGPGAMNVATITWIDSGNESSTGQVICSYDSVHHIYGMRAGGWNVGNEGTGGKVWSAPIYGACNYKTSAQFMHSMLDANVNWPLVVSEGRADVHSDNVFDATKHVLGRTREDRIETAASYYFNHLAYKHIKQRDVVSGMIPTLVPGAPDYEAQRDILVGIASGYDYSPMSKMITPPVTYLYPSIFESQDKLNTELSCAERAQADPQTLMVNAQAATYIMNYVSKVFAATPHNAQLESFGCCWSGSNCEELFFTPSNIYRMFEGIYDKTTVDNWGSVLYNHSMSAAFAFARHFPGNPSRECLSRDAVAEVLLKGKV